MAIQSAVLFCVEPYSENKSMKNDTESTLSSGMFCKGKNSRQKILRYGIQKRKNSVILNVTFDLTTREKY